jgi:hypothetical protein
LISTNQFGAGEADIASGGSPEKRDKAEARVQAIIGITVELLAENFFFVEETENDYGDEQEK